ncbi:placenta growth factor [Sigmodon hispidus]
MKLFTCFLQVLAGLAVHSQGAPSAGNSSTEVKVVPFNEVWGRSYCRPIEKLVDIIDEYPDEVSHLFSPPCVPLSRCGGCCGDESLHCVSIKTANVTMQVGRMCSVNAGPSWRRLGRKGGKLGGGGRKRRNPQTEEPRLYGDAVP